MNTEASARSNTSAYLHEKAESAFRKMSEPSEGFRALIEAQEKWKACLPPDISAVSRASQHFSFQLESIRKLADDRLGGSESAVVAFQNSLKAAATPPPHILALAQASAKYAAQFEPIMKELAGYRRFLTEDSEETLGKSLKSICKKSQEAMIPASAYRDLSWDATSVANAEIKEALTRALTPLDATFYMPALVMPSVQLRPKRVAPVSEEFWLSIDPDVTAVSRKLFEDGHFAKAVFEAMKRFDIEVKNRSMSCGKGVLFGVALMKEVFSPEWPIISVADCSTITGRNIQKGMMHLSMGLMSRIRNPLGHENVTVPLEEAKVWIGLVSQLMKDLKGAPLW